MNWTLVFTAQAKKDAKKLASSGLKDQAERLLDVLAENPYQAPPRYERLVGNLAGAGYQYFVFRYAERVNEPPAWDRLRQHRPELGE